jgi:hypothetical protein
LTTEGDAMSDDATQQESQADKFAAAAEEKAPGFVREFFDFLLHNKKWWLTPIIIVLLVFGLLVILAGTGAAPFIYTLF